MSLKKLHFLLPIIYIYFTSDIPIFIYVTYIYIYFHMALMFMVLLMFPNNTPDIRSRYPIFYLHVSSPPNVHLSKIFDIGGISNQLMHLSFYRQG